MRHERHETGTNIENYISIALLKVKDAKKRKAIFFRFVLFQIGSTKVGRKSRYFMPVKGPGFKEIFIFKLKTHQLLKMPPLIIFSGGFPIVKRWRSNADLDLLLLPSFL